MMLLALIFISGLVVAKPHPGEDASWRAAHCEDDPGSVLAHLLYRAGISCDAAGWCRHSHSEFALHGRLSRADRADRDADHPGEDLAELIAREV